MATPARRRGTGLGSPRQKTPEAERFRQDVERHVDTTDRKLDAAFVLVEASPLLPSARTLAEGTGVTIADGGEGEDITVAADPEYIRDTVAAFVVAGTDISVTHNDAGNTLTIAYTGAGGAAAPVDATYVVMSLNGTLTNERRLTAGTGITVTDGGANGNVTIATTITQYTNENAQDTVFGAVVDGNGIDTTYNDGANTFTIAVDETELSVPDANIDRGVYEVNFSALANNAFADGTESIDGINWTVGGSAAAGASWGITNGIGIILHPATSTASTFSSTTQSAPHLYVDLATIVPNYDPSALYRFEFYVTSLTCEGSGDSFYFGLWNVASTPAGASARVRAVGPRNQTGTVVPNTLAQTTTSQGTENLVAAGYTIYGFTVDHIGVTSMYVGTWSAGWTTPTCARQVTTNLSAGDPLANRGDSRLVISGNFLSDATPTTIIFIERMRIVRVG